MVGGEQFRPLSHQARVVGLVLQRGALDKKLPPRNVRHAVQRPDHARFVLRVVVEVIQHGVRQGLTDAHGQQFFVVDILELARRIIAHQPAHGLGGTGRPQ
jgi:hypothetical protein